MKLIYDKDQSRTLADLNGTFYEDLSALTDVLRALADVSRESPVILDIGGSVPLGDVIRVYDVCVGAGFDSVNFAADPPARRLTHIPPMRCGRRTLSCLQQRVEQHPHLAEFQRPVGCIDQFRQQVDGKCAVVAGAPQLRNQAAVIEFAEADLDLHRVRRGVAKIEVAGVRNHQVDRLVR